MCCVVLIIVDQEGIYEGIYLEEFCVFNVFFEDDGFQWGVKEV